MDRNWSGTGDPVPRVQTWAFLSGSGAEALGHCSESQGGDFVSVGQIQPVDSHPHPWGPCTEVQAKKNQEAKPAVKDAL